MSDGLTLAQMDRLIDLVEANGSFATAAPEIARAWAMEIELERDGKIKSGQIVLGGPPYWFRELRWSDQAWAVLHAR